MPYVYRSVRLVLQNNTDDLLTIEGCEVLKGSWTDGLSLKNGETFGRQSARAFGSQSTTLTFGTEAYARLASVDGYLQIHWSLPWVGPFTCQAQPERKLLVQINDEDPAALSVLITVLPVPHAPPPLHAPR